MRKSKPLNLVGPVIGRLRRERGWRQTDLALHLQLAGWNITRGGVAKIESQLVHVDDHVLCYLRRILRVEFAEMFPEINPHKTIREGIAELHTREPARALAAA